jgi:hypothetical protein
VCLQRSNLGSFELLPRLPKVSALLALLLQRDYTMRGRLDTILGHLSLKHDTDHVINGLEHLHTMDREGELATAATAGLKSLLDGPLKDGSGFEVGRTS